MAVRSGGLGWWWWWCPFFLTAEGWSVCYFSSHTYQPNSKSTAYYTEAKLSWGFSQKLSRRFALERWASEGGNVALQGRKMPCHGLKSKKNNMPSCPLYLVCIMLGVGRSVPFERPGVLQLTGPLTPPTHFHTDYIHTSQGRYATTEHHYAYAPILRRVNLSGPPAERESGFDRRSCMRCSAASEQN